MIKKKIDILDRKYIIYRATSPSNKVYIGYTYKRLSERKSEHQTLSRSNKIRPFPMALKKYNLNFIWEIIEQDLTLDEAAEKEKYYIALYKSTDRDCGYNLSPGVMAGSIMSEEGKKRHKEKMDKHYANPEYVARATRHVLKERDSDLQTYSMKMGNISRKNWNENYEKMIEIMKTIHSNRELKIRQAIKMGGKPFICNETGEIFALLKDAADIFGVDKRNISKVLNNPKRHKTILRKYTFSYIKES